jgi:hypothetical protein
MSHEAAMAASHGGDPRASVSRLHSPPRLRRSWPCVGSAAGSPEPLLGPSPATGHDADMLDVYDPDVGDDADTCLYQPPQRGIQPTCRTG